MESKYTIIGGVVVAVLILYKFKGDAGVSGTPPEGTTDDDIRNLARQGQKILAIKRYRVLHHVGLNEAKDAVEEMM